MDNNTLNPTVDTVDIDKPSLRTFLSYTVGGVGRDMTYSLYANFVITFILFTKGLTDAQFGVISGIIIACRVWDAINDPVMGSIIENTHTKWGKFKPWILSGAILAAVVLVLLFATTTVTSWSFVILFGFMAFLWSIFFTMNDISYWSMLPSLSSNPKERSKLTAMANLCAAIGGAIIIALTPMLTAGKMTIGGNAVTAYAVLASLVAVVFIACTCLTVFGVKEKPMPKVKAENVGLKKMVSIIRKNDQLLWTALVMLLYNLGSTMILAFGTIYIYFEFEYNGTLVLLLTIAYAVGAALINIFYPQIAERFSRKKQLNFSIISIVGGYMLFLIMSLALMNAPNALRLAAVSFCMFVLSFGQSLFYMMLTINIANTVEYNEWKTGQRNEGIIFSIRPFMAKMGSALQQLFIMIVYLVAGVTAITSQISDIERDANIGKITDEVVKESMIADVLTKVTTSNKVILIICMTVIPVVLMGLGYIVVKSKFKIDENFYKKILKEIEERKENSSSEASENQADA